MSLHINSPLLESRTLSLGAGCPVWLKLDALQPSGSFKLRGIGHACNEYVRRGARRLISSSGGNAGIAVAYAGRLLQVPVLVVVPETTSARAIELIRQQNAEVRIHGASWQEANALALSLVGDTDAMLHPFDDPLLWQGHASMIDEVAATKLKPDLVVLSVGGGGLLCGVLEGMHRNGWQDVPVLAVETEGAASFDAAVKAGAPVELPAISSLATSLGARQVCDQALEWTRHHAVHNLVVSDQAAIEACLRFMDDQRLVVEPACGASLAAVYNPPALMQDCRSVLVIVCGGVTASVAQLQQWAQPLPAG
ncbi:pyridoxal-phosphate dependent enzyme [Marinobacterium rhizophilum]|uniref:L-serine ammonia-lyase n=1 Tax=Marinobacterium rhizophilum TaxID=420402 RepID=A0ABY5HG55_9GAMM|nr:pyridoxal-phosphate dependent enzyme [Marinobacterium rhizophilum]UTW10949.1 pyridoxal-phosphate dependent enzyme [Marinobacterium rhizophilum]